MNRCFACDRKLSPNPYPADTRDGQYVLVHVKAAGEVGYQPPKGGPRLYLIPSGLSQEGLSRINRAARGSKR